MCDAQIPMSSARINTMFGMAALAAPMAARSNMSCDGVIFLDQTLLIVYGGDGMYTAHGPMYTWSCG